MDRPVREAAKVAISPNSTPKPIAQAKWLLQDRKTTIKDVAETFGVSRATIYRSLELGKFAETRIAKRK